MTNNYPNPWDFSNTDKQLVSSDNKNKLEYEHLNEIVMGAPVAGKCEWVNENGHRIIIGICCAGPPIWNTEGTKAAIPIWTESFWKGTHQKLSVLNIESGELITYKHSFGVLDLRSFSDIRIYGYDSPIHNTKTVDFDIRAQKIESKRIVKKGANMV